MNTSLAEDVAGKLAPIFDNHPNNPLLTMMAQRANLDVSAPLVDICAGYIANPPERRPGEGTDTAAIAEYMRQQGYSEAHIAATVSYADDGHTANTLEVDDIPSWDDLVCGQTLRYIVPQYLKLRSRQEKTEYLAALDETEFLALGLTEKVMEVAEFQCGKDRSTAASVSAR